MGLTAFLFDRLLDGNQSLISEDAKQQIDVTLKTFESTAESACSHGLSGLDAVAAAYPHLSRRSANWLCFDLTYMLHIVRDGLNIPPDQRMMVANQMTKQGLDFMVSWALGVSIEGLTK